MDSKETWDEGTDILPFLLNDIKRLSSYTPGSTETEKDCPTAIEKQPEIVQLSNVDGATAIQTGDVMELHLENGQVIGNGEWWRCISMPLRLWYPVLRNQATGTAWKVRSCVKSKTQHKIAYGSTVRLISTESEAEKHNNLCAWFSTYVYSTIYDKAWSQCYEWRIISANDEETSPLSNVRYGDKVVLMNVYYRLFLSFGASDRFLTIKNRKDATVFILRSHYRQASLQIEALLKEKLKLEEEKSVIQKAKDEAFLKNKELQEENEKKNQQILEDQLLLLEGKKREEQVLQEKSEIELDRKRVEKEKRKAEKKVEAINELKICVVCMERERNVRFEPCGHICICQECGSELNVCPLDNQPIVQQQKAFAYV